MKKFFLAIILVFLMSIFEVKGLELGARDGIEIQIYSADCQDDLLDGYHLDILVRRSQVSSNVLTSISENYQSAFGHIDTIDYLSGDNPVWISYLAYVENAHVYGQGTCHQVFASMDEEYLDYSEIILVYFNDLGETICMTTVIRLPIPKETEMRYGHIDFYADETFDLINNYSVSSQTHIMSYIFNILIYVSIYFGIALVLGVLVFSYGLIKYLKRKRRGKTYD